MRTSKEQIVSTSKAFDAELHEALNYTNTDLTPEGIANQRQILADRVRARYAKEIDGHRSALYLDKDRSSFDSYRPRIDWNNSASVNKAQAKWTGAQGKLDAGLSIGQIIATADDSTLAAINEFYADHAEVQAAKALTSGQTYEQPDVSLVHRAVDDRAAEVKGDNAASALTRARGAAGLHAYAEATLSRLDDVVNGREDTVTDLGSALQADYVEQQAMAGGSGLVHNHDSGQEAATVSE
ncbi:MAG: hypothetical protein ACTIBG_08790 [Brevibacterium aurantiacum]|uniref:hypothetical protein n=1 Tax=Brevibacterium aurantiacum TaxID=273384 RepID=UPI003F92B44D